MSEHDLNQNEEADAASNMATIASKPTGISRSDLIAKMVAYASSLDKETLAQAAETIGMSPDDIYNNNAHLATGDNSAKNRASINSSNAAPAMPMSEEEMAEVYFKGKQLPSYPAGRPGKLTGTGPTMKPNDAEDLMIKHTNLAKKAHDDGDHETGDAHTRVADLISNTLMRHDRWAHADTVPSRSFKAKSAKLLGNSSVKEDLALIFGDSTDLSEDFKLKIDTLFEAAVSTRVSIETIKLEESFEETVSTIQTQFETDLEESVEKIQSEMLENVDNYINYAVAEWISENKLAIESGIRTEIAESFMLNLKNVFEEHYIDIPEDKVDVVESMAAELEEMKSRLNETTERNIELSKVVNQKEVEDITTTFAEGMTDTQKDKFVKLTESINYSDSAEFRKKVLIIKETYFPTKSEVKVTEDQLLSESVEEPEKAPYVDPSMNNYVASISRTLKK